MQTDKREEMSSDSKAERKAVLELVFILLLGFAVLGGFISALSYDFISARAPLFIMVPLMILIALQFNKCRRQIATPKLLQSFSMVVRGENKKFNSVFFFAVAMLTLLLLIYAAGHYAAIALFMLVMFRKVSGESWKMSLSVTLVVVFLLYALFEFGFNIELYRGYFFRVITG